MCGSLWFERITHGAADIMARVVGRVGPGSCLRLSKCVGPACKISSQRRTLLSPVIIEAIELIQSSIKMIILNYLVIFALQRHQYHEAAHIMSHSVNVAFRLRSGFKNKCPDGFGLQSGVRLQLWSWQDAYPHFWLEPPFWKHPPSFHVLLPG